MTISSPASVREGNETHLAHVDQVVQENDADGARHRSHLQHLDALLHLDLLVVATDDCSLCVRNEGKRTSTGLKTVDLHLPREPLDGHFVCL